MQEQIVNFKFFLAIQTTTSHIEMAIFDEGLCVAQAELAKSEASKNFLVLLEKLLEKSAITVSMIQLCVVNCGPSPFTLLRTALSYVNGLQASLNLWLLGVDNFSLLTAQENTTSNILILQNAFGGQLYFYYKDQSNNTITSNCDSPSNILKQIQFLEKNDLIILGNGYALHANVFDALEQTHKSITIKDEVHFPSIHFMGSWIYQQLQEQLLIPQQAPLMPLYLKKPIIF